MAHSSNKEYYEHLAAAVLEQYYSEKYRELIPQDKPDLRADETLGIEVTQAMGNNGGKEFGLFRIVRGLKMSSIPERQLAAFERYGCELIGFGEDRVVEGFIPSEASLSMDHVEKCFCNKLEKMKNYPEQMTVDLFVFAAFLECKGAEELQKLCAWCSNKQKANAKRIRFVIAQMKADGITSIAKDAFSGYLRRKGLVLTATIPFEFYDGDGLRLEGNNFVFG